MPNPTYRKLMQKLVKGKMRRSEFEEMVLGTNTVEYRWLHNVLLWVNCVCRVPYLEDDDLINVPANKMGLWHFLKCICSTSPVSSYLPASDSDWIFSLINSDIPVKSDFLAWIRLKNVAPILFKLFDEIPQDHFPELFKAVLLRLVDVSKKPYEEIVPDFPARGIDKMT